MTFATISNKYLEDDCETVGGRVYLHRQSNVYLLGESLAESIVTGVSSSPLSLSTVKKIAQVVLNM